MTTPMLAAAAEARAQNVRQRADRPSQRRSSEQTGARALVRASLSGIQIREAGEGGGVEFVGHASVYERGYEMWDMFGPYTEVVSAGAGAESLARADLDVPLVLGHDQMRRLARTTTGSLVLAEDENGLSVHAPQLDPADVDVAYILPKLRAKLIDEMSFAFRIEAGQWSPDYSEYRINRYDIHRGDVAIVGYGANPYTGAAARQVPAAPASRARALLELALAR
ncbi:HK97 family phage prohead protease [Streptomyces sp. NPDC005426]|uniref:HK97 family phage prohead protease n=1 Tax=Streptomyces sp. NPDC005426 TaxID=3155344 RepID=UPI00339F31F8